MDKGRTLALEQRTKAESDFAVAAVIAREKFIDWLDTAETTGVPLPRGVSASVKEAARKVVEMPAVTPSALSRRCTKRRRSACRRLIGHGVWNARTSLSSRDILAIRREQVR
jgi:ribonuclease HIII